jgi:hypothetical protein
VAFVGCSKAAEESFSKTEFTMVSYAQYCKGCSVREFDPIGAESISVRSDWTRDSYDSWWKIKISKDKWLAVCSKCELGVPKPFVHGTDVNFGIPNNWPDPEKPAPEWWLPPAKFGSLVGNDQWNLPNKEVGNGWYWLYDVPSSTVIVWRWNRQYWSFDVPREGVTDLIQKGRKNQSTTTSVR